MAAITGPARRRSGAKETLGLLAIWVALVAVVLLLAVRMPSPSVLSVGVMVGLPAVAAWMFTSENYALTLGVLLLYLGLLDGFVKLGTGISSATLGRDVLLYAIAFGALARFALRREPLRLPPLSGWVLAFVLVVLVSVFNPGSYPIVKHGLPSVRPHLEFVALFFFGYYVLRDTKRMRMLLVLMLVCGAVNGVVNAVQFNMSADELSSWGPGYAKFIKGEGAGSGGIAGRTFATDDGDRVRPFGLGSDAGGGGIIAVLAIPGAIALIGMAWRRPRYAAAAILLSIGCVTAVVTSQGRGVIVAGFVMVLAFAALTVSATRLVPTLAGLAVAGAVTLVVISAVSGNSENGNAFSRYESIRPTKLLETTRTDRGAAVTIVPTYIRDYPLGHGLGTGGPAAGFGGAERVALSAESEFAFLVLEVGVIGLIVVVGFALRMLQLALTRIRRISDSELRMLLAAVASPLFGIFALFVSGAPTSGSPLAPYFWFVSGALAYWLISARGTTPPDLRRDRAVKA